ncbi:MAG TPA: response regulator, partial [Polyangiales bacterium]|nr:response regulator [Polyangiales bacterium]
VRTHLAEQSRGRVRFRDDAVRELPSFLMKEPSAPEPEALEMLSGKRVLVADDDPAVLWFFSGLLRESGAQVLQANNGRDALSIARRKQPHLIVSDILMPKVDGFALCREVKRDALLAHVPVILLSWKDDFLERMRELDAGANGYLRKESGPSEVLRVVCDALRPRQQLSAALRNETEVTGRIEGLGVISLLERVAAERPDARVVVQDAWNLFEVEIRRGERVALTRTAADGNFARGERALLQLVGVNSGRFAVTSGSAALKNAIALPLAKALAYAGNRLAAMLDAVSDRRLVHVALLAFEEEVLAFLLNCTPTRLHEVAARFRSGGVSARDLLFDGSFTPAELESDLRELARRGALTGVWDAEGEDLVAAARREREEQPGTLLHSSHPQTNQTSWYSSLRPTGKGKPAPPPESPSDVTPVEPSAPPSSPEAAPESELPLTAAEAELPLTTADEEAPLMAAEEEELPLMVAETPAAQAGSPVLHEAVEGVRLLVTLAALVAVGYFGWQRLEPRTRLASNASKSIEVMTTAAPGSKPPFIPPTPAATPTTETAIQSGTDPAGTLGTVMPYIDSSHHVAVGPEQGLLVLQYVGSAPAPLVRIDDRELGRPPRAIALDAGRHELMVHKKSDSSFRYLLVRAGETRVITLPF